MNIHVGSKNKAKVAAVKRIIDEYPLFAGATLTALDAHSGVANQPLSLDETIQGAKNRAKNAWNNCEFSIGIESGLMPSTHTRTGYFDVCAAAIFDGNEFAIGLSGAFEYPPAVIDLVHKGREITQAAVELGLGESSIRENSGMVGLLTNGRVDRADNSHQALQMALVQLEHSSMYKS